MSRSMRKTPITGYSSADSEHEFKKQSSRTARVQFRTQLAAARTEQALDEFRFAEGPQFHTNSYAGPKDGKTFHGGNALPKNARKYLFPTGPAGIRQKELLALMRK